MGDGAEGSGEGKIRVAVSGACGRMGRMTCAAIVGDPELDLVAVIDPAFAAEEFVGVQTALRFVSLEEAIMQTAPEVMVDFTTPAVVCENALLCVRWRVPVVIGTTGLSPSDLAEIEREIEINDVPVLIAPNFAMGAVLMMEFAKRAAEHFQACEIIELHHEGKLDMPSGTSRLTRVRIEETWRTAGSEKQVPIHSVRLPGLVAHQEVLFGG
ncbi:MAG: 4-hydroxy-tetrahydrodipicolinate reductase, partial [Thermoleophilia bacterium]|nr:4-hydroxy-tetrahydrodipicolinate reductase [Thermoleophilia bacterium]